MTVAAQIDRQVGWWCTAHNAYADHRGCCTKYDGHTTCAAMRPVYVKEWADTSGIEGVLPVEDD